MGDLFKGVLGGGWSILVGWIVPSALNVLALVFVVLPPVHGKGLFSGHSLLSGHSRREGVAAVRRGMMARRQTKPKKRSCQVAPPCG
jgi:hypothetical protein